MGREAWLSFRSEANRARRPHEAGNKTRCQNVAFSFTDWIVFKVFFWGSVHFLWGLHKTLFSATMPRVGKVVRTRAIMLLRMQCNSQHSALGTARAVSLAQKACPRVTPEPLEQRRRVSRIRGRSEEKEHGRLRATSQIAVFR